MRDKEEEGEKAIGEIGPLGKAPERLWRSMMESLIFHKELVMGLKLTMSRY